MMAKSKSEVGHAKNAANLAQLIADLSGFGPLYNPPRSELQINNLQQMYIQAQAALRMVTERGVMEQAITNERAQAFKALRPLVTRIINTMVACGLSEKTIADARAIQRRINGVRASKKSNDNTPPTNDAPSEETTMESEENGNLAVAKTISASRQSFDLLIEHFTKLLLLLQREPNYTPNEPDLQVGGLQAHEEYLRSLLQTATNAEAESAAARRQRTELFYEGPNCLVALGKQSKNYVKALFGVKSQQYKRVSKLTFRYIR